jgi:hypothetical protein
MLIGLLAWLYWESNPPLSGTLRAQVIDSPEFPSGLITPGQIDLPAETVRQMLHDLKGHPLQLNSRLVELTLECTPNGIQVTLQPGKSARCFRIDPSQNLTLWKHVQQQLVSWDDVRQRELQSRSAELLQLWHAELKGTGKAFEPSQFLSSVGLAALVGGQGYQLDAVAEGTRFHCAAQDPQDNLYYLLPADAKAFELRGRELAGKPAFPGAFQVTIAP